jgi:hypothetical protein
MPKLYTFTWPPTPSCWFATQSHSSEIQLHLRFYYQIFDSKLVPETSAAFFKIQDDELCSCDCPTGPLNLRRNSSHEVARPIENVTKHALYPVSNGVMYWRLDCQCSVLNYGPHCMWNKHSTNMLTLHMLQPSANAHYQQWLGTSHPTTTQSSHFSSAQTLANRNTVMTEC